MSSLTPRHRALLRRLLAPALVLVAGSAHAADPEECIAAHERGQRLERDGRLLEARAEFSACAADPCPGLIRQDCVAFSQEVAAQIPSVVLGFTDAQGNAVGGATVVVDDARTPSPLDARTVELDPGAHRFVFRSPSGETRTMDIVLHDRERMRVVATLPPSREKAAAEQPGLFPAPTLSYVFGGIGIAGLASFTGFAISGKSKQDELEQCAPHCSKSEVDVMRTRYLVGDISLAVGVASLGAAAYFFFADPFGERAAHHEQHARVEWTAFAAPGVASASVRGRF